MISRIKGELVSVGDASALVEVAGISYELMIPSALAERLKETGIGKEISFETIYFIEAGDKKANEYPRLVGFLDPLDREFFSLLTQVSGMGVRKALKSLILPIRDIASAIEMKDTGSLSRLPGVGKRLSEKIIAELHGKTTKFALSRTEEPLARPETVVTPFVDEAMEILIQLQYSRTEAQTMIQAAIKANPKIERVEDLITIMFRNEREVKVES
ncbi:MAG: hypothetical protein IPH75_03700 [bacterium]|nr:hypothetical protein [bacterium]